MMRRFLGKNCSIATSAVGPIPVFAAGFAKLCFSPHAPPMLITPRVPTHPPDSDDESVCHVSAPARGGDSTTHGVYVEFTRAFRNVRPPWAHLSGDGTLRRRAVWSRSIIELVVDHGFGEFVTASPNTTKRRKMIHTVVRAKFSHRVFGCLTQKQRIQRAREPAAQLRANP